VRHPKVTLAATFLVATLTGAAAANAPNFEPVLDATTGALALRSTGSAYYAGVIRVYDAALYAVPGADPDALTAGTASRCLILAYRRAVSRDLIVEAANEVLERQGIEAAALGAPLDQLHAAYRDVGPGDRYRLCHTPGGEAELALNGEVLARVGGDAFATAYFGIWLRDGAISEPLRESLLGIR
jgi:hypothetical protein